jgi:hypothetical protein
MRKLVDDVTIQNAYMQAIEIIENVGVRFESEASGSFLRNGVPGWRAIRYLSPATCWKKPLRLLPNKTTASRPKESRRCHTF